MENTLITKEIEGKLVKLAERLIDQKKAEILVAPQENSSGFWFGGGDMITDDDGSLIVVGRYRNYGDSRTGLKAGERGLECAIFKARTFDGPFEKIKSFSKADLSVNGKVVKSIEGTSLRKTPDGIELYISTEKEVPYPEEIKDYQKPGTGVWTIDMISAPSIDELSPDNLREVIGMGAPEGLHVKDPVIIDDASGDTLLMYCVHPFSWTCSYTAFAIRKKGEEQFRTVNDYVLPRGHVWDLAAARITDRFQVPKVGVFKDLPPISLYFYDSCECVRQLDENPTAVKRPRGYSCEELGGLAWSFDDDMTCMHRLSVNTPLFVSPYGTGCSRYIATLTTNDAVYASWQQSKDNLSQPLVGNKLSMDEINSLCG